MSLCFQCVPHDSDRGCAGGQAAVRQGQLRMMPPAGADVSCIAFTTGTAAFAVLHWLLELRAKVAKNGYGGAGNPNPNSAQPEHPALLLLKGKAGRTESPPAAIADAIGAMLAAAQLIGTATITPQARPPCAWCCPGAHPPGDVKTGGKGCGHSDGAVAQHRSELRVLGLQSEQFEFGLGGRAAGCRLGWGCASSAAATASPVTSPASTLSIC